MDVKGAAAVLTLLLAALTGCQGVYTRQALPSIREDLVIGEWRAKGEADTFHVRLVNPAAIEYSAQPKGDEKPVPFQVLAIGAERYVQAISRPCEPFPAEAECFSLARIEFLNRDTVLLHHFDTAAMFQSSLTEKFAVPYELLRKVGAGNPSNNFLLTGAETEIRGFLAKFGRRFTSSDRDPIRYERVAPPAQR